MIVELIAGAIALLGGIIAISARVLLRAILGLALVFLGVAGLLASLGAWYLAVGQLFLFIGGVITFLVLVFNTSRMHLSSGVSLWTMLIVAIVVLAIAASLPLTVSTATLSTTDLAATFYSQYAMLLVPALLLLFAALIAAQHLMGERA